MFQQLQIPYNLRQHINMLDLVDIIEDDQRASPSERLDDQWVQEVEMVDVSEA